MPKKLTTLPLSKLKYSSIKLHSAFYEISAEIQDAVE